MASKRQLRKRIAAVTLILPLGLLACSASGNLPAVAAASAPAGTTSLSTGGMSTEAMSAPTTGMSTEAMSAPSNRMSTEAMSAPTTESKRSMSALTTEPAPVTTSPAKTAAGPIIPGQSTGTLPVTKIVLESTVEVNLSHHSATLPLHEGRFHNQKVWYILTEASDEGAASDLNVNFAPKLANVGIGCRVCVQELTLTAPTGNRFGEGIAHFEGIPNFSPTRVLAAGPTAFPPAAAAPGAVGDAHYSPFVRFAGSTTVYNAPIVATGDGPFDVVHHSNTADRVLKINPVKKAGPGQYYAPSVEFLLINGFDSGQPILYISTESSDAATATLERATFVPLLARTPFTGGDDFAGSVRERIFPFVNGQTGTDNPQAQGLAHLISDGHASEDASLSNQGLIRALINGGDALNVQGDFPTLTEQHRKFAYSPLWEANFGQWTDKAVKLGLNKRQTDEFQILNLAKNRPDLLTGPMGMPYGSTNVLINCPVIAFTATQPTKDLVEPVPGAQVETNGSFSR